jgi:peptide chain release factor 2
LASKEARIKELEVLMEAPHFWDDNTKAQKAIAEINACKVWITPYLSLKRRLDDIKELFPEAEACGDEALIGELLADLDSVGLTLADLEVRRMLSGEMDNNNCFLSINAGAGGTEACDWALMLSRMYQRWAIKKGWAYEVIDVVDGDVAGIKSTTLKFTGEFAYGYAKSEKGVHRLVRISPFDANAKRHTSFASVDVSPEVSDDIKIEVRPEDLRIDTYRASGAGGQHVNKTDSAVRITHLPTGLVVSSQSQRSQIQNREYCMKMLKSKLYEMQVEERKKGIEALSGDKKEIAWGSQIRNYVFQPYTLVKDTRTGVEVGNVTAVMDGDIDVFVNAYLKESEDK